MFSKALKKEVNLLKSRVRELEELICPVGSHEFVILEEKLEMSLVSEDVFTKRLLKCSKCKKTVVDTNLYCDFSYKAVKSKSLI